MTSSQALMLAVGAAIGFGTIPLLLTIGRWFAVEVEDDEAVLITRFGRLAETLTRPGLHMRPSRVLPWVKVTAVSLRRDFRLYDDIHVNDARGTTVMVDLWLEIRVTDPAKALFEVAEWDRSLKNLVSHAATSILGNREFQQILCDRNELGELLRRDIGAETARWGIDVDLVFIRNVSLLPEVSRQMFETVAARLERAKAHVQESGRLRVAMLEAETSAEVATLVADAKGQYPAAVGRAFARIKDRPEVLDAYNSLYELSVLRPHRTIAFAGFDASEMRAVDAAMLSPISDDRAVGPMVPPLRPGADRRWQAGQPTPRKIVSSDGSSGE